MTPAADAKHSIRSIVPSPVVLAKSILAYFPFFFLKIESGLFRGRSSAWSGRRTPDGEEFGLGPGVGVAEGALGSEGDDEAVVLLLILFVLAARDVAQRGAEVGLADEPAGSSLRSPGEVRVRTSIFL